MPKLPPKVEVGKRGIEGNFLLVPLSLLDGGISHLAALTWASIYMHSQMTPCQVRVERLACLLHRQRRQVDAALRDLEGAGFLERTRTRGASWYRLILPGSSDLAVPDELRISASLGKTTVAEIRNRDLMKTSTQSCGNPQMEKKSSSKKLLKETEERANANAQTGQPATMQEWRSVLRERHPLLSDHELDRIVMAVEFELSASGRHAADYLAFDRLETTNPRTLRGPKGYYRDLARRLPRTARTLSKPLKEEEIEPKHRCAHCGGTAPWGIEPDSNPIRPCLVCSSTPEALEAWRTKGLLASDLEEVA